MPSSTLQSLFLVAAVCVAIGGVFGWLIASLRGGQNESNPAPEAGKPSGKEGAGVQRSLLHLTRDPEKGVLLVGLGGKPIPSPEVLTLEERKQLVDLLHETMTWAGIPTQAEMPLRTDNPETSSRVAAPGPRNTGPLNPNALQAAPSELQRPTVLGGMTNALADVISPAAAKKEDPKSIVQQIDEILQEKLMGTELAEQKIGLVEDLRKGVLVRIGAITYEGIGSVPDGLVKDLLKASVQEWEKRQEIAKRRSTLQ
jgi:hypothetical protein